MPTLHKFLRRLFHTAAAVSMLLLLATLILWPVSYYRWMDATYSVPEQNVLGFGGRSGRAFVESNPESWRFVSGLHFATHDDFTMGQDHWSYLAWKTDAPGEDFRLAFGIFDLPINNALGVSWLVHRGIVTRAFFCVPFSYLALLFSILPLLAFRSIRRRRKLARIGHCPKCGYNLHAHPPGTICPECGTPVASPQRDHAKSDSPQRGDGL